MTFRPTSFTVLVPNTSAPNICPALNICPVSLSIRSYILVFLAHPELPALLPRNYVFSNAPLISTLLRQCIEYIHRPSIKALCLISETINLDGCAGGLGADRAGWLFDLGLVHPALQPRPRQPSTDPQPCGWVFAGCLAVYLHVCLPVCHSICLFALMHVPENIVQYL